VECQKTIKNYFKLNTIPFWGMHAACLLIFFVPFHMQYVYLALALYLVRMFFVTAGYHRYFSHRAFSTNRVFQFVLAFMAMTSSQKGILWWAAHHRDHHRYSDQHEDIHTPQKGFWWSHMGWILSDQHGETNINRIKDFLKFPELVWLDRFWVVPFIIYGAVIYYFFDFAGFVWGFFVSTVFLWHGTFTINSLSHVWGTRPYETNDHSRNNPFLAMITLGEGWHNNHHRYPKSVRNGLKWWEFDVTYYVLKTLSWFKVIKF
jgi:stearoyl-CoA desaturase (delta-9 desaturase)